MILLPEHEKAGMYVETDGDNVYLKQGDRILNTFTTGATVADIRYTAAQHLKWQREELKFVSNPPTDWYHPDRDTTTYWP